MEGGEDSKSTSCGGGYHDFSSINVPWSTTFIRTCGVDAIELV